MKKTFYFAAIVFIAFSSSCGNDTAVTNESEGLTLINKSDCSSCHNATAKVIGPSFKDIAAKYPNTPENIAKLTDEVIKGSSGVWGQVPMTPHTTSKRETMWSKMVGKK